MIKRRVGRPPGSKNKPKPSNTKKKYVDTIMYEKIKKENLEDGEVKIKSDIKKEVSLVPGHKKPLFNCKKCSNKNFKFEKSFKEHMLLEHSELPGSVPCPKCHVVCPDEEILDIHMNKAHNRDVFECPHCLKHFVRQSHVLRHLAQKGCDGGKVIMFPCEICDAQFTRKDNLIVHLRQMHINRAFYHCKHDDCGFSTKNYNKLIRHWHAKHAEVPHQFVCDTCNKATSSRAAMSKHLEIHGVKKFACDVCGYSTYTLEVIRRHVLTHMAEKPYKCGHCDASFIQRAQLTQHMTRHDSARCSHCGEQFNCKARLLVHERGHSGETSLRCVFTDCTQRALSFHGEAQLIAHVKAHLVSKQHSCAVCKKRFDNEANMRRHLSTHTLDRPRRCMYCVSARAYVRGQQLVRHVRNYHRDVFQAHLQHVRTVIPSANTERVTHSEMESILTLLDAEAERILEGCGQAGVLYGGMQTHVEVAVDTDHDQAVLDSPLMSEEDLADNLSKLLVHLIDEDTLQCLGWPEEPVDVLLEKVIEQCGARAADRAMWSRVQRLRENAKHLFVHVVDDAAVTGMLSTHTIDQIVRHLLAQADHRVLPLEDM